MLPQLLVLVTLLIGCGTNAMKTLATVPSTGLQQKYTTYLRLITDTQDAVGFIETTGCDSLLFTGLAGAAGMTVDITTAQSSTTPGKWFRRPLSYPECYATGASTSTISRDQLLGLMWYAAANRQLGLMNDLSAYGVAHGWIMGQDAEAGISTLFTPNFIVILDSMLYPMGLRLPFVVSGTCSGFECHLALLQIGLMGYLNGFISQNSLNLVKYIVGRDPNNALAAAILARYTTGDLTQATQILLSRPYYPADRLPTSADVCEAWPMQREDNDSGLRPCPEQNLTHSGGDFLFTAWYIMLR